MHADKWGPLGSVVTALCCLGAAPVVGALTAAGLGFLIDDRILIPLLILFLGATLWALDRDRRRHGRPAPLVLGAAGAVLTVGGLWVSGAVVGLGLALVFAASLWNWWRVRAVGGRPPYDPRGNHGSPPRSGSRAGRGTAGRDDDV